MENRKFKDFLGLIALGLIMVAIAQKFSENKNSINLDELSDMELSELKNKLTQMGDADGISLVQEIINKRGVKRIGPSQNGTY